MDKGGYATCISGAMQHTYAGLCNRLTGGYAMNFVRAGTRIWGATKIDHVTSRRWTRDDCQKNAF